MVVALSCSEGAAVPTRESEPPRGAGGSRGGPEPLEQGLVVILRN